MCCSCSHQPGVGFKQLSSQQRHFLKTRLLQTLHMPWRTGVGWQRLLCYIRHEQGRRQQREPRPQTQLSSALTPHASALTPMRVLLGFLHFELGCMPACLLACLKFTMQGSGMDKGGGKDQGFPGALTEWRVSLPSIKSHPVYTQACGATRAPHPRVCVGGFAKEN